MARVETSQESTRIFRQFFYGVGHVINDVTRLLIQSFRLVFLMKVVNLSASNAGWIIIFSRITNAFIIKPLVGYLCDKVSIPILSRRHGKRKSWHLIGTVIQAISVPLLFSNCLVCSTEPSQWQLIVYYGIFNTLAWLSVILIEVAHLSIIPFIAKDQQEAVKLNGLRMTLVFLTGTVSFLVVCAILGQDNRDHLKAESSMDFTVITLILIAAGLVFAVIFHVGTKEPISDKMVKGKVQSHKQVTNEQLQNGPEKVKHSEVTNCLTRLSDSDSNRNEHDASKEEHLPNAEQKTFGFDNKGFVGYEEESTSHSPGQTKTEKNDAVPESVEENHSGTVLETFSNKEMYVVSCDLESALPAAPRPKTVRAWLKDPNLYKVAMIFACTRILQDVSYSYLPLYLTDRLNFQKYQRYNKQPILTFDQQLYWKAQSIIAGEKSTSPLRSVALRLGGFHAEMSFLGCIGSIMSGSGLEETLQVVYTTNTVVHMLRGKAVQSAVQLHFLGNNALSAMIVSRAFDGRSDDHYYQEAIANMPLVVLISAMVSAGISKKIIGTIGSKLSFILAALCVIGSSVWFYFITQSTKVLTYPAAALLGFGFSAMYVNAFSFITELIGENKSNSGFVFSFGEIAASLLGGVLIGVIQNLFPQQRESAEDCEECGNYVRIVLSLVPGLLAFVSLLIVLVFQTSYKARKENASKADAATQTDESLQQTDASVETEDKATNTIVSSGCNQSDQL